MANSPSTPAVKGLDLGTSRIVVARPRGEKVAFDEQLNAFVALPYAKMTEGMLERESISYRVENDEILAYGNRVDEFANIFGGDTRRPMQTGLLNSSEPLSLQMVELMLEEMVGEARKGEKICFSVPGAPPGHESDLLYHERTVTQFLEALGYQVKSLNEGLAIVFSELESAGFTGIGVSFGGGMCNVCLAYLGLPVITFCTVRAGDYIDRSAASVTGNTPVNVRMHKEEDFVLDGLSDDNLDQALSVYYGDVVRSVVDGLETHLADTSKLPRITKPIPIALGGGTARVDGFEAEFEKAVREADLPIEISDVELAKTPHFCTAKGTLMAALLNM